MNTKQRRPTSAIPGPVRLAEPDVRGQHRKADVAADAAFRVEHRRPQPVEAEAATALPTDALRDAALFAFDHFLRSEEHTSELQSLMRISYAAFCLKKKNIHNPLN